MARKTTPLSALEIKSAKPKDKKYKLSDGRGLFLQVNSNGSKLWRLKYRFNGKEKEYAIGTYPDITLSDARKYREKLRNQIANNIDPNEIKKKDKEEIRQIKVKETNSFYKISQNWLTSYECQVSNNYYIKLDKALDNYVYPFIKNQPIEDITRLNIIEIIEDLKNKEIYETANRVFMLIKKIFMYAVTHEYIKHNIVSDIDKKVILGKITQKHYPTFTKDHDIKGLLNSIDEYMGDYTTKMALKMIPYVFVRSFNIRHCEWNEINFNDKEWIIPAHKMKTKTEFILPLPNQVISILTEMKRYSGDSIYVFPSSRTKKRAMSDNTLNSAIRRMGYSKDEFVPHGFRAMFSTIAYEKANDINGHGYTTEVIEALLAHKEPNKVKSAYNRSSYKNAMRGLIEWYANYLDRIKIT